MLRLIAVALAAVCVVAAGCNEADNQEASTGGETRQIAATPPDIPPDVLAGAMLEPAPPAEEGDTPPFTDDEHEFEMQVKLRAMELSVEYGVMVDDEAQALVTLDGSVEPFPLEDIVAEVRKAMAEGDASGTGLTLSDPNEAVRFVMDQKYRPDTPVSSTMPPGMEPPPADKPPLEEALEMVDPVAEQVAAQAENTRQLVAELASHYGLSYDEELDAVTGDGFPEEGIPVGTIVAKVEQNVLKQGGGSKRHETEVRAALSQLAEAGRQVAGRQDAQASKSADPDSATPQGGAGATVLNYYPEPDELLHPKVIYGDWQSLRDDHPRHTIDHDLSDYDMVLFRYQDTAVFELIRDGQATTRTEFPYRYDPRSGVVELIGADGKALQSMTVWATQDDPLLIWVQKEGSRIRTLYEKKGRGGEPVTLDDEVEGVRIMLGDEEAEAYRQREEAKGRR